eukprot:3789585-Lingulodinium_polyedra.AAC.1
MVGSCRGRTPPVGQANVWTPHSPFRGSGLAPGPVCAQWSSGCPRAKRVTAEPSSPSPYRAPRLAEHAPF